MNLTCAVRHLPPNYWYVEPANANRKKLTRTKILI